MMVLIKFDEDYPRGSRDVSRKSMDIFPDAQGQLTLQSMVGSGGISNSFKILWFTCENEENQNKNEGNRVATSL